jgi:hypothetical protein
MGKKMLICQCGKRKYFKYNLGDLGKMFQNGFNKILVGNPERRYFKNQQFT